MSSDEFKKALSDLPLEMKLDYYKSKCELQEDYILIMEEKLRRIGVAYSSYHKYKLAHRSRTKDRALTIAGLCDDDAEV